MSVIMKPLWCSEIILGAKMVNSFTMILVINFALKINKCKCSIESVMYGLGIKVALIELRLGKTQPFSNN